MSYFWSAPGTRWGERGRAVAVASSRRPAFFRVAMCSVCVYIVGLEEFLGADARLDWEVRGGGGVGGWERRRG